MNEKLLLQDLVSLLAKKAKITQKEADRFYRELFQLILESIYENDIVKIKDLGTFKLVRVNSRESVDVNTGEKIEIPPHLKLSFIPDKGLKALVNKPFAQFESVILEEGMSFDSSNENNTGIKESEIENDTDLIDDLEDNNEIAKNKTSIQDPGTEDITKFKYASTSTETESGFSYDDSGLLTDEEPFLSTENVDNKITIQKGSSLLDEPEKVTEKPEDDEDISPLIEKFKKELGISKKDDQQLHSNTEEKEYFIKTSSISDKNKEIENLGIDKDLDLSEDIEKEYEIEEDILEDINDSIELEYTKPKDFPVINKKDEPKDEATEKAFDLIEKIEDRYSSIEGRDSSAKDQENKSGIDHNPAMPGIDFSGVDAVLNTDGKEKEDTFSSSDIRAKLRGLFSLHTDESEENTTTKENDLIESFFQEIEDESNIPYPEEKENNIPDIEDNRNDFFENKEDTPLFTVQEEEKEISPFEITAYNVEDIIDDNIPPVENKDDSEIVTGEPSDETEDFDFGYNFPEFEKKSYFYRLRYKIPIVLIGLAVLAFVVYKFVDLFDVTYDYEYYINNPGDLSLTDTLPLVMENSNTSNRLPVDTMVTQPTVETPVKTTSKINTAGEKPTDMKELINKLDKNTQLAHYSYDISDKLRINVVNKGRAYLKKKREQDRIQ